MKMATINLLLMSKSLRVVEVRSHIHAPGPPRSEPQVDGQDLLFSRLICQFHIQNNKNNHGFKGHFDVKLRNKGSLLPRDQQHVLLQPRRKERARLRALHN